MQDFEILGAFYLGKQYDLKAQKASDNLVLYDSKDLVTHAVCVGMTGSGKTGLCLTMLEEAALDSVPVIAIDPKGDLANLLLTFPDLAPSDFEPWINEDDARRNGKSPAEYATAQAELWKKGLGIWGQDGERIRKMRATTELAIYTPGSSAGIQLSIMKSFTVPPPEILEDGELLRERISTTVISLLGLLGIAADPIRSRELILLSNIINACWQDGKDLDLVALIQQIQQPPFTKVGVMDLESFYPGKERFELAMAINNLLASPGFSSWMEGEPLDIKNLLYTPQGKPKISIISIAHLNDAERMFMVSLLLNQVLGWMRQQSGTTSLRAILYMDEIFGYFPPVANPPSKQPLLTLVKQARAFGLGIMLATQNPVDLDYKGLANTGTWFIGRLQTERDKARVLEGLEGAAASQGGSFDRQAMEETLAGLGNRVFLMNNVHNDAPIVFETRWAMSYLRGPLTRSQIKQLTDPLRAQIGGATMTAAKAALTAKASTASASVGARPLLGADVRQYFLPVRSNAPDDGCALVYAPMVIGGADIHFLDSKLGVDYSQEAVFLAAITDHTIPVDWTEATPIEIHPNDLETEANEASLFGDVPSVAGKGKSFEKWGKDLADFIFRNRTIDLLKSDYHAIYSNPDESERDFRVRLNQLVRESRDDEVEKLRSKYAPKFAVLEERLRRAEAMREKEAQQAQAAKMQGWMSVGASLLGAFMGNKLASATNIRRGASALGSFSRASKQAGDVGRADETVEAIQAQIQELDAEFQAETQALQTQSDPMNERLATISIKTKKKDINLRVVALAWTPQWRDERGDLTNAWE